MDFRKPRISTLKWLSLLAALALTVAIPVFAQDASQPEIAPQNPAFLDFVNGPRFVVQNADNFVPGLVPEPFSIPLPAPGLYAATMLPATYDLRPLNKLTPIRDQGSAGSCWAFASIGSLESFLMPGEAWNFSENNLKNTHGFDIAHNAGGNRAMSTAYLARWSGPINEADDPYNPISGISPTGLIPVKHVQDVIFIPVRMGPLDNDSIKQAVMTYGAVYTTYYHSNSYYNSSTASYYFNGSSISNHAVCIVGWDDNYPAGKFLTPPPDNGAFLIRNSWGTYWGISGYYWMSYYDSRLGKTENAVFNAEPVTNHKTIYQYDTLGWVSSAGYGGNTAWFANVFTATSNDPITAASWYCPVANSTYEVYIYTNPTSGPINSIRAGLIVIGWNSNRRLPYGGPEHTGPGECRADVLGGGRLDHPRLRLSGRARKTVFGIFQPGRRERGPELHEQQRYHLVGRNRHLCEYERVPQGVRFGFDHAHARRAFRDAHHGAWFRGSSGRTIQPGKPGIHPHQHGRQHHYLVRL